MIRSWTVKVYGGDGSESNDMTDPYAVDDRGLWFDGRYTYLTVSGLTLHLSSTQIFWTKPHGDGTLFSNSIENTRHGHDTYMISIKGLNVQVELTGPNWKFTSAQEVVTSFIW